MGCVNGLSCSVAPIKKEAIWLPFNASTYTIKVLVENTLDGKEEDDR